MQLSSHVAIAPNAQRLLWAGFLAILAAGIGAGVRGGILANWAADFGFTGAQLGAIGGAGFTGFCFGIIIGGVVVDKIGYGKLVVAAFAFHVLSAFITFAAAKGQAQATAYHVSLHGARSSSPWRTARSRRSRTRSSSTLFPQNRTHYLNILHASWPAGLVLGGLIGWILGDGMHVGWKMQLGSVPGPDGALRCGVPRPAVPQVGGVGKRTERRSDVPGRRHPGRLVVCFLVGLFFKDQLARFSRFSPERVLHLASVELPRAGRSRWRCC